RSALVGHAGLRNTASGCGHWPSSWALAWCSTATTSIARLARASCPRSTSLQLVHPRRILLAADSLCHRLSAFLPERRGERGDSGLLHAHGRGDVVHDSGARHHLLCVAAPPRSSHLLVCAWRAGLLDQHALL